MLFLPNWQKKLDETASSPYAKSWRELRPAPVAWAATLTVRHSNFWISIVGSFWEVR
jgi:hypothetical protein